MDGKKEKIKINRQIDGQKERKIDGWIGRKINRQMDKINRQIDRKKDKQIDRQIDRQIYRYIDRKMDKKKDGDFRNFRHRLVRYYWAITPIGLEIQMRRI